MVKLFVAADLADSATTGLAAILPPPGPGTRLVQRDQMHLTLHFLGAMDSQRTTAALQAVAVPAFPLVIEAVGQFSSGSGSVTLWAGVRQTPELLGLHTAVATALAGEGFRPEARRYTPHVTLARCRPEIPSEVVAEFLARHQGFSLPAVLVERFGVYSSVLVGEVPVNQREWSFVLRGATGGGSINQ